MRNRDVQGPLMAMLEGIVMLLIVIVLFDAIGQQNGVPTLDDIVVEKEAGTWDPNEIFENNPGPYRENSEGTILLIGGGLLLLIFVFTHPWGALDGL